MHKWIRQDGPHLIPESTDIYSNTIKPRSRRIFWERRGASTQMCADDLKLLSKNDLEIFHHSLEEHAQNYKITITLEIVTQVKKPYFRGPKEFKLECYGHSVTPIVALSFGQTLILVLHVTCCHETSMCKCPFRRRPIRCMLDKHLDCSGRFLKPHCSFRLNSFQLGCSPFTGIL